MSLNDPLANALSSILNSERKGKTEINIMPVSKVIKRVLDVMNENNYIGKYTITEDNRGEIMKLALLGKINNCAVIKPRYSVKKNGYEKFEKRYLPAKNFGFLIISTSKGIMTHNQAIEKKLGGKLIAYCY